GVHRSERHRRVDKRLALLDRARLYRHVDDVAPEPLARELEGGARPGRVLEEEIDDGAAAQQRLLLVNLPVLLDIALGAIEQERDLVRRKALDSQQVAVGEGEGRRTVIH